MAKYHLLVEKMHRGVALRYVIRSKEWQEEITASEIDNSSYLECLNDMVLMAFSHLIDIRNATWGKQLKFLPFYGFLKCNCKIH